VGRSLTAGFRLLPCEVDGFPVERDLELPDFGRQSCETSVTWYGKVGYIRPWIGYVAVLDGPAVGGGGFKEPPHDHRVAIARQADPTLSIAAQTLPEENAPTSTL